MAKAYRAPKGTRDFYPDLMLRRRWVEQRWRAAAAVHGFDEIDGPRFETLGLYTAKSGEGIVSELFSFRRDGGDTDYALRPECTPTVARMYAAHAGSLPKPTRWSSVGPYFRAERPQRGRLREFLQWNIDVLGDGSPGADADIIACCVGALQSVGLGADRVKIRLSHRELVARLLKDAGVTDDKLQAAFVLLDKRVKLTHEVFTQQAGTAGLDIDAFDAAAAEAGGDGAAVPELAPLWNELRARGVDSWCGFDIGIVRGLAYYTGMVFEAHETSGAERAVAGGGRYDGLVERLGGPPTPAVGGAMGDVVLGLVLEDNGVWPGNAAIREDLGIGVDAFVFAMGADDAAVESAVAGLRGAGLRVRRTHKATRNFGKLLKDAGGVGARVAVAIEEGGAGSGVLATVKDLRGELQHEGVALDRLPGVVSGIVRAGGCA